MLILVGCNHRSAPIEVRERLAFPADAVEPALARLVRLEAVSEGAILSTCNRVEVLARTNGERDGLNTIRRFLADERGVQPDDLDRFGYSRVGLEAVRHLFRVATGLDSMILGEPQILGQVRQAYHVARGAGTVGTMLERTFQQCLATAKRVRTETGVSRNAVSVAYAAVTLARQIFGALEGRSALVVGGGKMGTLVARHLATAGVGQIAVTSRRFDRASVIAAEIDGIPYHWDDGLAMLDRVDVVVSCTGSAQPVLDLARVEAALRSRRGGTLFIIDIAVPRDVDPAVNQLNNVYLYDVDELQRVVDNNLQERREAARLAEVAIDTEVVAFDQWRQSLEVTPLIVRLRERMLEVGHTEVARFRHRLGPMTPDQERQVEKLIRSFVQKILHRPTVHLREAASRGDTDSCARLYRKIFDLDSSGRTRKQARDDDATGPSRIVKGGRDD